MANPKKDSRIKVLYQVKDLSGNTVDPTSATVRKYVVRKPDGTIVTWPATGLLDVVTDDGAKKLQYVTEPGVDLRPAGVFHIEPELDFGDSPEFEGRIELLRFFVSPIVE